jgi:hypothetical protein
MKTQNSPLSAELRKKVTLALKNLNLAVTVSPEVVELLASQLEEKAEKAVQAVVAQHVTRRSLWAAVEAVADRPVAPSTTPSTGHAAPAKAPAAVVGGMDGRPGARG